MVTWSDHAKADLRHIHDFIANDSRHYAKTVTQAIVDKTLRLSELPRIGKVVPEINDEDIRGCRQVNSFKLIDLAHEYLQAPPISA